MPISNADRSQTTKAALMKSARRLFVAKGYAETGTPEIVANAKVTRGALYHHFSGKQGLCRAVMLAEAQVIAGALTDQRSSNPSKDILQIAELYIDEMLYPGRAKLLLIEAPAALTPSSATEIRSLAGGECLQKAVEALSHVAAPFSMIEITYMLHASVDRAALCVADGDDSAPYLRGLSRFLRGLTIRVMGGGED